MKKVLLFTFIIIIIPIILVKNKDLKKSKYNYGIYSNKTISVQNTKTGEIKKVLLEEYVKGVVAGEMPASFHIEALKAQAVASRTYALKKAQDSKLDFDVTNDTNYQVYLSSEEIKEKFGDNYNEYIKKINEAVNTTKGEVILYNNNLIDAMFFSTSNGYTENSEDVFSSNLPYLSSVESKWDKEESPVFSSVNEFSKAEFLMNLGLNTTENIDVGNIERTKTGRVKNITINNKKYKSSDIRSIFNLRSTSFEIKVNNNTVVFEVKGFGHGVGLSQYGANGMAKNGYDYEKILTYYYQDCEIKKIN